MNVRISHGIELSKVPQKLTELLEKPDKILINSSRKLDLIVELMNESDGRYCATSLEMLDEMRQQLAQADQLLLECQGMLEGYVQAVTPKPEPEVSPQVKEEPESLRLSDVPRGKDAVTYGSPTEAENVSSR